MAWLGRKKLAFIPLSRTNIQPPDIIPPDWPDQIMQRVFFDPATDPTTGDRILGTDRSVREWHEALLAIGQSQCPLCPETSDFDLLSDGERVIDLDSEISDRTFHFLVAKQKLDRTQVAGATVDQGRLRAAERVRAKDMRVQSDARNPFCDEPRVLPCRHGLTNPPAAGEEKFAWHLAGRLEVVVNGLAPLDPAPRRRIGQNNFGDSPATVDCLGLARIGVPPGRQLNNCRNGPGRCSSFWPRLLATTLIDTHPLGSSGGLFRAQRTLLATTIQVRQQCP